MLKDKRGLSLVEILIIVGIVGAILAVLVVALNVKQKEIRDSKRIGDMQVLRSALEVLKNETGGYEQSYCDLNFVGACAAKDNSQLVKILPGLKTMNDPKTKTVSCAKADVCAGDNCNYTFVKLDSQYYEIRFHLERGINEFVGKGCYRLTPDGISKL